MPEAAHRALQKEAKKKFPKDKERQDKYVYGALNKIKKRTGRMNNK